MGGADDPTVGEALYGMLLIGLAGVVIPALVVLPVIGLGIWAAHRLRARRTR
ncbi:hypothetical protein [Streptomyces phaeofaciens]|uniref:hypothetical protein n=1 Tax=Streptomyces phaeofaciens TaxID=68254 RepID=UPI00368ABEA6